MTEINQKLIGIIINAFDSELVRLSSSESIMNNVVEAMTKLSLTTNPYSFFSHMSIRILTQIVVDNQELLQFILNVTMKVKVVLATNDVDTDYVVKLFEGVICKENEQESEVLPKNFTDILNVSKSFYSEVCSNNFWIFVLFIVVTFYQESSLWKTLDESSPTSAHNVHK